MNDNKVAYFFEKYGGLIIGLIIGLVIFSFSFLFELFKFILVVGVCAWIGNYIQRNKEKVKTVLKDLIDKM